MVDPTKYRYKLIIVTSGSVQYDVSDFVENLSWEEGQGELAGRISFTAKNDKTSKGTIASLAQPGCYVGLLYDYNGKNTQEAARGKIVEWNPSAKMSSEVLRVKAYDLLYDLQESQDNIYFKSGTKTQSMITQILKKWGITVSSYKGPNVKHGKTVYKTEKLGTAITKILKEAKRRGGTQAILRAVQSKVNVVAYGSNSTVYHFDEAGQAIQVNRKFSTVGLVTVVKVIGKENDDGSSPVEVTAKASTDLGTRQKIISRGSDESLQDAKTAAMEIIKEDGIPKDEISIKLPDMPVIRKGDMIHLKMVSATSGYYYVIGILHEADTMTMTLDLQAINPPSAPTIKASISQSAIEAEKKKQEEAEAAEEESEEPYEEDEPSSDPSGNYTVGSIVTFNGGTHYVSSDSGSGYPASGPGPAKITMISAGSPHPYHLVTQDPSKTSVYGWVNAGTFE